MRTDGGAAIARETVASAPRHRVNGPIGRDSSHPVVVPVREEDVARSIGGNLDGAVKLRADCRAIVAGKRPVASAGGGCDDAGRHLPEPVIERVRDQEIA